MSTLPTYCPVHEWEHTECDTWCEPRKRAMVEVDRDLHRHFRWLGYGNGHPVGWRKRGAALAWISRPRMAARA